MGITKQKAKPRNYRPVSQYSCINPQQNTGKPNTTAHKKNYTGQQWRNRCREQTYGHGERGGEGEMYGESDMETYFTICKPDSQWEFAICLRKFKTEALYHPRGVGWGRRWKGGSRGRGYMYTYG